jgi:hypothetical protein
MELWSYVIITRKQTANIVSKATMVSKVTSAMLFNVTVVSQRLQFPLLQQCAPTMTSIHNVTTILSNNHMAPLF